ncbi:protein kinase domain-containing protein [Luteitalea pratensis]|uniref:protein kinase domain-containing protein n=1 Tax=Luteitalea pratensis TaxID=1855912 RepID=UPI0012FF916A|nr:protein kinase [Luteitalea pratensis]
MPFGFVPHFDGRQVTVEQVQPATLAARGGLRPHDRLRRANGQVLEGRVDWQRMRVQLDPSRPLELDIERDGHPLKLRLPLSAGLGEWWSEPVRPGLIAFRGAEVIVLGLALLVAYRRSSQPSALLGAWLLASFGTLSVALPGRMFFFWQELPQPLEALLWVPFATSFATGPLLFAFFAVFPRRALSPTNLAVSLLPGVAAVGWFVFVGRHLNQPLGAATGLPDAIPWVFATWCFYALAAIGLLIAQHRRLENLTDRRRTGVLLGGLGTGVTAGVAFLAIYKLDEGPIFGNPLLTVLALGWLAGPAAFAYAILRHRLFDLPLIVRQGVRYALARRLLDALIPLVGALLVIEAVLHRNQPLSEMVQARWWWYALAVLALAVIRRRREHWLAALDRHFFRERYDAERLLQSVVTQIDRASAFESVAPVVVQQIDEALHPVFVDVLRHAPGEGLFTAATDSAPRRLALPASLAVIGVLSVLRKPLAISLGDTAWVRHQLPLEERTLLLERGVELLVPVFGDDGRELPIALVVLGPRRSEEPYNTDDLELLSTIAQRLGLLLARSHGDARRLAECDSCGRCFDEGATLCTHDGDRLSVRPGSRMLNGRYRLERRRGRGGMGTVYEATDDVLDRKVAVKVIREDLASTAFGRGAPGRVEARFRREARAAAGFAHAHVVRVYDFGVDHERQPFLVMELLEGETLRQRLAAGAPLAPQETLLVLRGLCAALDAAHRRGLVHRDLKPENVFLQQQEHGFITKVLDFGLARAFAADWPAAPGDDTKLTSAGLMIGTLDYMAPEQLAGDVVSPSWDLWALAVIAHEMLTTRHPFRRTVVVGNGLASTIGDVTTGDAVSILPPAAATFFDAALSSDRTRRPPDPMAFLAKCEEMLA